MKQWKVRFMRKGSEPPYPFGKSERIVAAETKANAIAAVRAEGVVSPRFKITASAVVQVVGVHAADCAIALNPRHECSCRRSSNAKSEALT